MWMHVFSMLIIMIHAIYPKNDPQLTTFYQLNEIRHAYLESGTKRKFISGILIDFLNHFQSNISSRVFFSSKGFESRLKSNIFVNMGDFESYFHRSIRIANVIIKSEYSNANEMIRAAVLNKLIEPNNMIETKYSTNE